MKTFRSLDEPFRRRVISNTALVVGVLILLATFARHQIAPLETRLWVMSAVMALMISLIPILVKKKVRTSLCGLLLVFCMFLIGLRAGMVNGGMRSPGVVLFLLIPMIGFFSAGILGGMISLALSVGGTVYLGFAQQYAWISALHAPELYVQYKSAIYIVAIVGAFCIGAVFERSRRLSEKLITEMSMKSIHSAKMAALGQMAAGIAHEINNPLTILSGFSKLITRQLSTEQPDFEKVKDHAEKITETTRRIEEIVKGLRAFSTPDSASPFEPQQVLDLIRESVALCGDRFTMGRVNLEVVCDEDLLVHCRPVQISQVILNLLANAYDAAEKLEERWVKVEASTVDKRVLLSVTDSGKGISPDIAQKIMEPFFTTKEIGRGTGLGLSISLGIARDHRGSLFYDEKSANTRFVLDLPGFAEG